MTAPEVVPCGHCGRPLTDPDSRALGYGPVCAAGVLGLDTHRTPVPRPRRRKDVDQIPLPLEANVSDEITRIFKAAKSAAPDLDNDDTVRRIVRAVLETLDALIDEGDEDSTWPDRDDLGLLAADLKEDA